TGRLWLWDVVKHQHLRHLSVINHLFAFGPDGRTLSIWTEADAKLGYEWIYQETETATGKVLRAAKAPKGAPIATPKGRLLLLSRDARSVLSILDKEKLCTLDLATGAAPPATSISIYPVAVAPDGNTLAVK